MGIFLRIAAVYLLAAFCAPVHAAEQPGSRSAATPLPQPPGVRSVDDEQHRSGRNASVEVHFTGPAVITPPSGLSGPILERADAVSAALNGFVIREFRNEPCYIEANAAEGISLSVSRCGRTAPSDDIHLGRANGWVITGLRVGDNDPQQDDNMRVKGLWLEWTQLDEAGRLTDVKTSDARQLHDAEAWEGQIGCQPGYAATGFIAHFSPGKLPMAGTDRLVGLQLICRMLVTSQSE